MDHDFVLEGLGWRLRPVTLADAAFITELRSDAQRVRYMHAIDGQVETQQAWLRDYLRREGDYYFVIERSEGGAEGLVGLYDVRGGQAEWGRWILREGSMAAVESCRLICSFGLDRLGLERVYSRTLGANKPVVSFHDSSGARRVPEPVMLDVNGVTSPAIEHEVTRATWPAFNRSLERLAARLGARIPTEKTT